MKKSTALGAVLCSAALAVGMAMPAMAATTDVGVNDPSGSFTTSSGKTTASTTVRVAGMSATQIVATVPVDITVAAPQGGGDIQAPSKSAYKITNKSQKAIKVTSIGCTALGGAGYTLETSAPTGEPTADGKIFLQLAPGLGNALTLAATTTVPSSTDWQAPASSGEIELTLSGIAHPSATDNTFSTSAASQFVKITYTVATA